MKSIRAILIIFLFTNLCSIPAFCQTGWYQVNSGTNKSLLSVHFINLNTGFSVGVNGTLIKTTNTGVSWQSIDLNDPSFTFRKVHFKDQSTGFILANSSIPDDTLYSRIYKTTDAGITWVVDQARINNVFLNNVEFVNSNIGYMSGGLYSVGPNKFFKTTNGGMSWAETPTGINGSMLAKKFINESTGFIGIMNAIYKTTNRGDSWTMVYENTGGYYNVVEEINFINGNIGFAAGGYYPDTTTRNRFVLKTTNAGESWNYLLNDNSGTMINSITVVSEAIIYAGGCVNGIPSLSQGFIIKSTNGGVTWSNESIPSTIPLSDIKNSNTKGFAVGLNGTIYKKDNIVSVTQISTEVPTSINLYQNYPNPFNPETTIKFDISKSGFISLKVYDISGKEVQNLFNGVKEAGSYQLKFDGVNLNNGVYFYKLMTNGTTITKSMVLVK